MNPTVERVLKVSVHVALCALLLASCTRTSKPNDKHVAGPVKVMKLRVGMVTFAGYAPLYLAQEMNYFDSLEVEIKRIESIGELRAAFNSGNIDLYIATPDIFQSIKGTEPPGVGFLAIDESAGADGVVASTGIKSVADLKGKKVGVEPGFPPYFVLQYMLHKNGLSLADLKFKDMVSQDAVAAFASKQLDAVGTYEPYLAKCLEVRKGSQVIASSKDMPGVIVDLVFCADSMLLRHKHELRRFARGWDRAVQYYEQYEEDALTRMAKPFGITATELREMKGGLKWHRLADNERLFDVADSTSIFRTFDEVSAVLQSNDPGTFKVTADRKLSAAIVRD